VADHVAIARRSGSIVPIAGTRLLQAAGARPVSMTTLIYEQGRELSTPESRPNATRPRPG